jgi:peptidoglycan hydrolase CwlO-like protein
MIRRNMMEGMMSDDRVKRLLDAIQRLEGSREQAKADAKEWRETIEGIEGEVKALADDIRSGQKTLDMGGGE